MLNVLTRDRRHAICSHGTSAPTLVAKASPETLPLPHLSNAFTRVGGRWRAQQGEPGAYLTYARAVASQSSSQHQQA